MKQGVLKKIIDKIFTNKALAPIKKTAVGVALFIIHSRRGVLNIYYTPEKSKLFDLVVAIKKEIPLLMATDEAYTLFTAVQKINKIEGDLAEVGVYRGGSAKLICMAKDANKKLHLFDTFSGLPSVSPIDQPYLSQGQYSAPEEAVRNYLKNYPNVFFHVGVFPKDTGSSVSKTLFSLVNLDVDTYKNTLECIEWFYPRLKIGGIMISHNYSNLPGVRKAFDDFFHNKPEPVLEMPGSQCLVVKVLN